MASFEIELVHNFLALVQSILLHSLSAFMSGIQTAHKLPILVSTYPGKSKG